MRRHPPRMRPLPRPANIAAFLTFVLFWAPLLSAVPLHAQTVRGRVLQSGSDAPVAGALVELRSAADSVTDQALTDEGGRFVLNAPGAGRYHIRTQRIGFADWDSEPFDLAAGESATRTVRVSSRPINLRALSVEAKGRCRLASLEGNATARVWAEVRKALRLTLVSERGELDRYVEEGFDRVLDPRGQKVLKGETRVDTAFRVRPYTTLDPADLAREGFVRGTPEQGRTFYAPGAETLLSEPFLDTHCVEVRGTRDVDGEPWIDLRFEPLHSRTLPEVEGSLWLAADGSELRELDFRYVNVELPKGSKPDYGKDTPRSTAPDRHRGVGGHVSFTRLPSGRWIIRDWEITMPEVSATEVWWRAHGEPDYRLEALRQQGGQVLEVRNQDGRLLFEHERATLGGVVFDSTRGARLAGATVHVVGTSGTATTDSNGGFQLAGLPAGVFTVVVRHPRLDSLGVDSLSDTVRLRAGSVTETELAVPSSSTLLVRGIVPRSAAAQAPVARAPATDSAPGATTEVAREDTTGSGTSGRAAATQGSTGQGSADQMVAGQSAAGPASGTGRAAKPAYALDRAQIEAVMTHSHRVEDLLRRIDVPGYSVVQVQSQSEDEAGPGFITCLKDNRSSARYRLSRQAGSVFQGCATVYVNDVPVGVEEGAQVLESMSAEEVCRIQVVPAIDAGVRFGNKGTNGVVLVYTQPCH